MYQNLKRYMIFWLSQSVSQLGSAMTSFALILWAYAQNGSAMTVSLMSFFNYMPYIIVGLFAGTYVDNHNKKKVMLESDSIAAVYSAIVFALNMGSRLQIFHIYAVNFVIGFMNAFQGPASAVAIGKIVPKEKLAQVSGMNSFSRLTYENILSPMILARSDNNSIALGFWEACSALSHTDKKRFRSSVKKCILVCIKICKITGAVVK